MADDIYQIHMILVLLIPSNRTMLEQVLIHMDAIAFVMTSVVNVVR